MILDFELNAGVEDDKMHCALILFVLQGFYVVYASHNTNLIGKTVKGTCKAVEASGKREIGVGQGRTDKMCSVGRHITAL